MTALISRPAGIGETLITTEAVRIPQRMSASNPSLTEIFTFVGYRRAFGVATIASIMKRFILQHTRAQVRREILQEAAEHPDLTMRAFVEETRRELAVLASDMMGTQLHVGELDLSGTSGRPSRAERSLFRDLIEESTLAYMVIDPRPGLHIVDLNEAYAAATMSNRRRLCGEKLFAEFPDNPDTPGADGVSNLYESLQKAAQSGLPHSMPAQRYDVRDAEGIFVERHWRPINTPIFDDAGRLVFLLHHVVDVTAEAVRATPNTTRLGTVVDEFENATLVSRN